MIKNVLIPEKAGNYYLFAKRIVGFYVDSLSVTATQIYFAGSTVKVEQVFHETVPTDEQLSYEERVAQVIKGILEQVGKYESVYTAMPSSQVIFKTLRLPFVTYEKIKMVINYEVEPLLPFELNDAVIDFIITKQLPDEGSSEVIVAAAQKSSIAEHISFFEHAGVSPHKIDVDVFSLYGLYTHIPAYRAMSGGVAFVDIGSKASRVLFVRDAQLKAVRVLPTGMDDFVTAVTSACGLSRQEARAAIETFGLTKKEDEQYHNALTDSLTSFFKNVQFTLSSFISQEEGGEAITKFILSGGGSAITGLTNFVSDQSAVPCELFDITPLLEDKQITVKKKLVLSGAELTSFSVVFSSAVTQKFNLLPPSLSAPRDTLLLTKQLIMGSLFIVFVFGLLFVHSFFQIRSLRREVNESQEQVIDILKERFPKLQDEEEVEENFDSMVEEAETAVKKQESVLFAFSGSPFLKYLLALHGLDQEGLGLEVERVKIEKGILTLTAKVRDFPELKELEKELRQSKIFRYEGSVPNIDFTMKIPLAKNG